MATTLDARPHVIVHVAVSLDGAIDGFDVDVGTYYRLAGTWSEDVTLVGADTILAQDALLAHGAGPGPAPDGPVLAVVDSRARVRSWNALRDAGHWSDVIALEAESTPPRTVDGLATMVAGSDRVDLASALCRLRSEREVAIVRVDSGGGLIGALLDSDLVDELSLLVHPVVAGSAGTRPWHGANTARRGFAIHAVELLDGGVVWLRASTRP